MNYQKTKWTCDFSNCPQFYLLSTMHQNSVCSISDVVFVHLNEIVFRTNKVQLSRFSPKHLHYSSLFSMSVGKRVYQR